MKLTFVFISYERGLVEVRVKKGFCLFWFWIGGGGLFVWGRGVKCISQVIL